MITKAIMKTQKKKTVREYQAYGVFFETLANQNRLKIINSLRSGKKNVTQILEETNLEQTCVSHCLKRLENCGFVNVTRDGKYRIYTLNKNTIEPLMKLIDEHTSNYCIHLIDGSCCEPASSTTKTTRQATKLTIKARK
jgi:ArsR family transcriptional regulator